MSNWRIGSFNGALLAAYFIPVWGMIAYNIMFAPVHALYEQPNISAALFISDYLHIAGMDLVRVAWLLALGRFAVIAFFAIFLLLFCVPSTRKSGSSDEALGIALGVGSLISFACMVMASKVGETGALRLHATELLLMLGTAIVLVFERPAQRTEAAMTSGRALAEPQLADSR
jgi:glucose dehydrogenase